MQDLDSTQLTDVQVVQRIGAGNFGVVYSGMWEKSTRVAMKRPKDPQMLHDFMAEARVLRQVNHPNIVRFLGLYKREDGAQFIVTEFVGRVRLCMRVQC